jgi:hypothetical protein
VGRVTGTWQGSATDRTGNYTPEFVILGLQPSFGVVYVAGPAGPLTLVITRDGAFSGTLRDTVSGEDVAVTATIKNYEEPTRSHYAPSGDIAPGATLTFAGRQYTLTGYFRLESSGRLTGDFLLDRPITGSDGTPMTESASTTFDLVKQK